MVLDVVLDVVLDSFWIDDGVVVVVDVVVEKDMEEELAMMGMGVWYVCDLDNELDINAFMFCFEKLLIVVVDLRWDRPHRKSNGQIGRAHV